MGESGEALHGWPVVDRWRRSERMRLLAARQGVHRDAQAAIRERVTGTLLDLLTPRLGRVVGFYWPYRGEIDLRLLMEDVVARGGRVALPAVVARGEPIEYRAWQPGVRLESNALGIPVPASREVVQPRVMLAPLLGFDDDNFRLGLGGGYFDRTLASLDPKPWTIGVGLEMGRLETIHPQPHDVPLDLVVTEDRVQVRARRAERYRNEIASV